MPQVPHRQTEPRRSNARLVGLIVLVFLAGRVGYHLLGVRFEMGPLGEYWQYLDPDWLRQDLWGSLLRLHCQPPLLNLLLGAVLHSGLPPALAFRTIYMILGLVLVLSVFFLQVRLGVSPRLAGLLAAVLAVSPPLVLHENWLFYSLPMAAVMALSAVMLARFIVTRSAGAATGFFCCLLALCGTWNLFHLGWFLAVLAACLIIFKGSRRKVAAAALVPLVLLAGVYAKNAVVFGRCTTGTWLGMNFWTMTGRNLPPSERERLVAEGALSPVAVVERFSPLADYPVELRRAPAIADHPISMDHPATAAPTKSSGAPNFNNLAYIAISDAYMRDSRYVLKHYPRTYAIGLARSWFAWFKSTSEYADIAPNRERIKPLVVGFDTVAFGRLPLDLGKVGWLPVYSNRPHYAYLFLLLGLPALAWAGVRLARKSGPLDAGQRRVAWYLLLTTLYVSLAGNMLESGENNRFRFVVDPFFVVLLGAALEHLVMPRWRRQSR